MPQAPAPRDAPPTGIASPDRPGQPDLDPSAQHGERTSAGSTYGDVRPATPQPLTGVGPSKDVGDRGRKPASGADAKADPTRQDPHARQFGAGPQTGERGGASADPGRPTPQAIKPSRRRSHRQGMAHERARPPAADAALVSSAPAARSPTRTGSSRSWRPDKHARMHGIESGLRPAGACSASAS